MLHRYLDSIIQVVIDTSSLHHNIIQHQKRSKAIKIFKVSRLRHT